MKILNEIEKAEIALLKITIKELEEKILILQTNKSDNYLKQIISKKYKAKADKLIAQSAEILR